ncbi:MAG TPA: hypothetical protein VHM67_01870 [Gemmatimonadaceae bacterium]|nr:hypothetical protein [Gemmatimonadaceae bacterium]
MAHRRFTHLFRRSHLRPGLLAAASCAARLLGAQATQPAPVSPQPPAAYRAPSIVLAQPVDGGTVFQDRPTILLRFAEGEPGDRVDLASFVIAVDDADRSRAFQLSGNEAWGPLAAAADSVLAIGSHRITARICSVRGACALANATVVVLPSPVGPPRDSVALLSKNNTSSGRSRAHRIIGAALDAARRLLVP